MHKLAPHAAPHAPGLMLALEKGEQLFEEMIAQQRAKVLRLAREAVPNLGPEDVLNPHDFPELKAHPSFEFEDGLLAGLVAAKIALRAELRPLFDETGPESAS